MALLANEVDLTSIPWARIDEVTDEFNTMQQQNNSSLVVTFNEEKEPFNNVKVRPGDRNGD